MNVVASEMKIGAIVPYFGGKRTIAPQIVREIGPHNVYWELCSGSLAVLFAKDKVREETVIDLHGEVTNLARVLASEQWWELCDRVQRTPFSDVLFDEAKARLATDEPDELQRAYDYLVVSWMGMNGVAGTRKSNANFCVRYTSNGGAPAKRWRGIGESIPAWHDRIVGINIMRRDIFHVLPRIENKKGTVIYIDPPYLKKSHDYLYDFDGMAAHRELARLLGRFTDTRVVVSYYADPALVEMYPGWTIRNIDATKGLVSGAMRDQGGAVSAPEVLLINGPSYGEGK